MKEKQEYRSAIRSRKLIRQAFLELLKEKDFEKITVTDIVKRAEINRSTFYAHYPDVMGMIDEIQDEILEYATTFFKEMNFSDLLDNPEPHYKRIVKLVEDNLELYKLLYNSSIASNRLEKIKQLLVACIVNTIDIPDEYKTSFEFEFTLRFFIGGIVDVYTQWIRGEIDCSFEEMSEQLMDLILSAGERFKQHKEA